MGMHRSQMLQDMHHVYNRPSQEDETQGQRFCRELYEREGMAFVAKMQSLERDHRRAANEEREREEKRKASKGVQEKHSLEADVGTRKCVELAEALLKELTGES